MKKIVLLFFLLYLNIFYGQFNYQREWATYCGGNLTQTVDAATDSQGNIYIVGNAYGEIPYSNNFMTLNAHQPNYGGGISDGFIAKHSPSGELLWATYLGGTSSDSIYYITIDGDDNVIVAGDIDSASTINFASIIKFSTSGELLWSYNIYENTGITCIASDNQKNIIICGGTSNTTEIATPNSFQENFATNCIYNSFIIKLSRTGQKVWGTYYTSNSSSTTINYISGLCVNSTGIYVSGETTDSTGFYATTGCHQPQNNGGSDYFLAKFNLAGERLWSTYYGGENTEAIFSNDNNRHNIICNENNVFLTGYTNSFTNISTLNTLQDNASLKYFAIQFNNSGIRQWGAYIPQQTGRITTDANSNCYIIGETQARNLATLGSYQEEITGPINPSNGNPIYQDFFVSKYNAIGEKLWGTYYGGDLKEFDGICIPYNDDFYICGTTQSTNNISTLGSQQPNYEAGNVIITNPPLSGNAFIAKFSPIPLNTTSNSLEGITLFPNPNTGNFTLQGNYTGDLAITIYDNQGRSTFSQETVSFQGKNNVAVASKLSSGIYFVKVFNDSVARTYKMIVK
jgi:Secretion system C-terminal sorting domain/Beta-propeller repeat